MIQLIKEGPKIPEELEQALRNDNLVFFCGAGISASNGLPLFKGLVEQVCKELDVDTDNKLLKSDMKKEDYASVFNLLESNRDLLEYPEDLRKKVIEVLNPARLDQKFDPDNHKVLLELSALSDNKGHRLVTTNFDKLFFKADVEFFKGNLKYKNSDSAPNLGPPRKEIWKKLTFLHGVIDEDEYPEGENLVLTKCDFGLAYLTEKWAANFIERLFKEFTILFIGYGINDPIMNYLVSAISCENNRKQKRHPSEPGKKNQRECSIYAFVGYKDDQNKEEEKNKWESIRIKPIPYKIKNDENHSLLYDTLKEWAKLKKIDSKKHYHDKIDEQFVKDIKSDVSPFYSSEVRKKFESFVKDLPDGMERAFQILSNFTDKDFNSAPYWRIFVFEASVMTDKNKGQEWVLKVFDKIENFSDDFLKKCLWWLIRALNMKDGLIYYENKEFFEKWWQRLWNLSIKEKYDKTSDIPSKALNSNLGKLSESIIQILWRQFPDDKIKENAKIPEDIKKYFEIILQSKEEKNVSALFHFGSDLSQLWYLDREWTIEKLKPLMNWEDKFKTSSNRNKPTDPLPYSSVNTFGVSVQDSPLDEDAIGALWQGYLFYNMFLGADFLEDFKEEFFWLLLNYKKIITGIHKTNYIEHIAEILFITTGGRDIENIFSEEEFKKLAQNLDVDILEVLARYIWILLKDTESNKTSNLWSEKIKPWIEKIWPDQTNKMSSKIAEFLSLIILNCGDELPEAFDVLKDKIEEVIKHNSDFIVYCIIETNSDLEHVYNQKLEHIYNYPKELLQILNWNFPENNIYYNYDEKMKLILNKLKEKYPDIEQDENYGHLYKKLLDKIT